MNKSFLRCAQWRTCYGLALERPFWHIPSMAFLSIKEHATTNIYPNLKLQHRRHGVGGKLCGGDGFWLPNLLPPRQARWKAMYVDPTRQARWKAEHIDSLCNTHGQPCSSILFASTSNVKNHSRSIARHPPCADGGRVWQPAKGRN